MGKRLEECNQTEMPYADKLCIHHIFEEQAQKLPGAIALTDGKVAFTYAELNERANQLAHYLRSKGVGPDVLVGICVDRSPAMVAALLGVMKAGGGYVPLDPSYPRDRLAYMLEKARVQRVLTEEPLQGILPSSGAEFTHVDARWSAFASFPAHNPAVPQDPDTLCYVIYTSGSTGRPKGVAMCHRPLVNLMAWQMTQLDCRAGIRTLQFTPLSFDVSFQEIMSTLSAGGTLILIDDEQRLDAVKLTKFINDHSVNRLFLPFVALQQLAEAAGNDQCVPRSLREIITAGEQLKISKQVERLFEKLGGCSLHNHYGPTETHVVTAYTLSGEPAGWPRLPPIGKPIANTAIYILDEEQRPAPHGEPGELYVGGTPLARGYLFSDDLTKERFLDDPFSSRPGVKMYRTGDLARFLGDRNIEYLGRIDRQVKLRGYRVELGEIEVALSDYPGISETAVVVRDQSPGDKRLVGYYVSQAGQDASVSSLRRFLETGLPDYMVPAAFVRVEEMPRLPSGKIDRAALPDPGHQRPTLDQPYVPPRRELESRLAGLWRRTLKVDTVGVHDSFFDLGGDSLLAAQFITDLKQSEGIDLSVVDLFAYPTIARLAEFPSEIPTGKKQETREVRWSGESEDGFDGVAIVGMGCRFPGADNTADFWRNLADGVDSIRFFSADELDPSTARAAARDPSYIKARGVINAPDAFDAEFFGTNPREAEVLDPQQRVFLETAWHALENAGYTSNDGAGFVGVFAGTGNNTYHPNNIAPNRDLIDTVGQFQAMVANEKDYVATRVAHKLNLRGPALSIHTACSTSLVAVAQAYFSLKSGQCDMAIAGGAAVSSPQNAGHQFQEGGIYSRDGHCRPFDANATGTTFSDGVGAVVLKRLADALADGDTIHAVIRGAAVNNDGGNKMSFMTPSVDGQAAVIEKALQEAGVSPDTITYVETHGTATPIGDPIEVSALSKAFRKHTARKQFCAIGSVKSNIGHLTAAAGVAGLIKTVLALKRKQIPASLHFESPNPEIDFTGSPFFVADRLAEWKTDAVPRRAGVSSFGVGGTNAHLVIEEAPPSPPSGASRPYQLIAFSAKTGTALDRMTALLADHLEDESSPLADVAYTLHKGRPVFDHRRVSICSDPADAIASLRSGGGQLLQTRQTDRRDAPVAFLFPGQGAQHVNMGFDLYQTEPVFQREVDYCADRLKPHLGLDLRTILYPQSSQVDSAKAQINQTAVAQPAIFVVEYALAKLWISWGITPQAVLGHSIGEYVAACLAGVFTLDDALDLLAARARLMQDLPGGSMLSVRLPEEELRELLPIGISLAAINSPSLCVASGAEDALERFRRELDTKRIPCRYLSASHAFHSNAMQPMLKPFAELVSKSTRQRPRIPWASTLSGQWVTAEDMDDPAYWARQIRHPVRFTDALERILSETDCVLLEVGPGRTLTTLAQQHSHKSTSDPAIASLGESADRKSEVCSVLRALGQLWLHGAKVNWNAYYAGQRRKRVPLPSYPFERTRYWVAPNNSKPAAAGPTSEANHLQSRRTSVENTVTSDHPERLPAPVHVPLETGKSREVQIVSELRLLVSDLSGLSESDIATSQSFVELGFDSLFLTQASHAFQQKYGVKITFRQLLGDLASIDALARHIAEHSEPEPVAPEEVRAIAADGVEPPAGSPFGTVERTLAAGKSGVIEEVVQRQLDIMTRQLELLRHSSTGRPPSVSPPAAAHHQSPMSMKAVKLNHGDASQRFGPFKQIEYNPDGGLTPRQKEALDQLITRYNRRTEKSKEYAQRHRRHYCDPRAAGNFGHLWKEMVYPIVCAKSAGSKIWDIDGNEYLDVTMGFGANYFGHSPDFVMRALDEQVKRGVEIGPQSPLAGEVAQLICEFTGFDRATFCNTGSEAVMAALRVARTVTGRDKVVYFYGDYHGVFDEVLGRPAEVNGHPGGMAIAPGIPHLANVMVLEYGSAASLETIRSHAGEIAAVLVEPVQARHPELQPREFLHELRQVTEQADIALIFDEVITGFRAAPGGAQEYFSVRADLGTYGKVIGGGMPIGVLAGKSRFMDALDGGFWQFGDASGPEVGVTFFAGTFVRHPLAIAAAHAVLTHLKAAGPALQRSTNERTERFARRLNSLFEERQLPMRLQHFSSMFYYDFHSDLRYAGLLFYYLRDRGVHIWEGRVGQLSTAHSDEDVDYLFESFKESVEEMQHAGFLPGANSGNAVPSSEIDENKSSLRRAPLTESQKEIWLSVQMGEEANCAFIESNSMHLEGALDTDVLQRSVQRVVDRHDALRATFDRGGEHQFFSASVKVELPVIDLTQLDAEEREAEVEQLISADMSSPFDLENGPVFRAYVIKLAPQEQQFVFTTHHLVCDGWSFGVVLDEISSYYTSAIEGASPAAAPVMQFEEYADLQEQHLASAETTEAEAFWVGKFKDTPPPVLELPTDRPRPRIKTYTGSLAARSVRSLTVQELQRASARMGSTLFATLFATFNILIHRLSNQDDIVIAVPAAGQVVVGAKGLVGHCLNLLPVRSTLTDDVSMSEFIAGTMQPLLDAYEHQNYTYGTLVSKLDLPRDPSRLPMVSVMFNIDNTGLDDLTFAGVKATVSTNSKQFVNFDLFVNLVQGDTNLLVECEYNRDLFDAATIERWLGHYETLLAGLLRDSDQSAQKVQLLSEEERELILERWNDTGSDYPEHQTINGLIEEQVRRTPDAIAVEFESERWTYAEMNRRANVLAAELRRRGVTSETLVGVYVDRSPNMIVAVLGVLKAGSAYVPLDPTYPADRLAFMIADAQLSVLVSESHLRGELHSYPAEVLLVDEVGAVESTTTESDPSPASPEQLAYVIYTSGSTGKPKGVQISHRSVVNFLNSVRKRPGMSPADVMLAVTTLSFDIAVLELYLPLITGARVVIASRDVASDGVRLAREIADKNVSIMQATPATWRLLIASGWSGNQKIKILCGGEALPPKLARELLPRCNALWNMYGPTETTVWSACCRITSGDSLIHVGRPIDNTTVYIVDRSMQPVPIGVPGELLIGGAGVARGYLGRPELTKERFLPNPFDPRGDTKLYRTGDLARYRASGDIECLGRSDSQVKIRGYRIELGEIEALLAKHPSVKEAVVVTREYDADEKRLVAYFTAAGKAERGDKWKEVWEELFQNALNDSADGSPNLAKLDSVIVGWAGGGEGGASPEEQVEEWISVTVDRIASLRPKRVLELGCGTGQLLLRLAPNCIEYWGTDITATAINTLEEFLAHHRSELSGVTLLQQAADNFDGLPVGRFDLVILNSVSQYLPNVEYLARVIEGAVRSVQEGGHVFVGDVQSFALLECYYTAAQFSELPGDTTVDELRKHVQAHIQREEELVVDPEFFHALQRHIPQIGRVETKLRRGRIHNETTLYHYDAVLHVGNTAAAAPATTWHDWRQENLTLDEVRERLLIAANQSVGFRSVPNARLRAAVSAMEHIHQASGSTKLEEIRRRLGESPAGIDPEEFWSLGDDLGFRVEISWNGSGVNGLMDVVFLPKEAGDDPIPFAQPHADDLLDWKQYANEPVSGQGSAKLIGELREMLATKLPDYMIPAAFVELASIPTTPNGKVDRQALPAPGDDLRVTQAEFVAPRTDVEEKLAAHWRDALGVSKVGVHDNFFELGGHSLLAVSVFRRIEEDFGKHLSLATLFKAPTIEQLARLVKQEAHGADGWKALVPIQPKGDRTPFFCVHGAGGNVLLYRDLAFHLGENFPFYGLQAQEPDQESESLTTIESMAARYLEEILETQPVGPYCLGGYCMGGTVALEIARQLREVGQEVALLALFDTYNFSLIPEQSSIKQRIGAALQKAQFHRANLARLSLNEMSHYAKRKLAQLKTSEGAKVKARVWSLVSALGSRDEDGEEMILTQEANDRAAMAYQPKPYPGKITVFKPQRNYDIYPDREMGWGEVALGGVEVVELPVDPHAMLVNPYARLLAAELGRRLKAVAMVPSTS